MSNNQSLGKAGQAKNDEFYTQLADIENELRHYQKHFKGKTILCNCDDPYISNFFKFFSLNFEKLKLKKLITTCYKSQKVDSFTQYDSDKAIKLEYEGDKNNNKVPDPDEIGIIHLESDGDFRSDECIEILKQADIVVTNPPFSLFREYIAQIEKYKKKFIIIGNQNVITYKETFKLIKSNRLWLGHGFSAGNAYFATPYAKEFAKGVYNEETNLVKFRNVRWFTNLDIIKRHENLICCKKFNTTEYPKYDNYDAINVNKIIDIPVDYKKMMGVPITFLDKYNSEQFEIIGMDRQIMKELTGKTTRFIIDGKELYARILIRHKRKIK